MRKRDATTENARRARLEPHFTAAEHERLLALRQALSGHAEHSEMLLDLAELEFARWLVEHGRMNDDSSDASPAADS